MRLLIYTGWPVKAWRIPDEQVARIVEVTRDQVIDVARRMLRPERFALTALGPAPGGALTEADWAIESVVSPAA